MTDAMGGAAAAEPGPGAELDGSADAARAAAAKRRRRGSRGGRGRTRPGAGARADADGVDGDESADGDDLDGEIDAEDDETAPFAPLTATAPSATVALGADPTDATQTASEAPARRPDQPRAPRVRAVAEGDTGDDLPELPDRPIEGKVQSPEVAERVLVRRPRIGDSRPAPAAPAPTPSGGAGPASPADPPGGDEADEAPARKRRRPSRGKGGDGAKSAPVETGAAAAAFMAGGTVELDDEALELRRGRERKGRPVGRYLMAVHVRPELTQIAVLEGRGLIEHYVSRPADDVAQIHGNIYLGRVQNVLPGMEAAFIDIGTPKNAVLYRGDVQYEPEDVVERDPDAPKGSRERPRIEQVLKAKQLIVCQVTK